MNFMGLLNSGQTKVRRFFSRSVEVLLVLAVVFLFFGFFTSLLFSLFPSGISLSQFVEPKQNSAGKPGLDGSLSGGDASEPAAARLSVSRNEVKSRSAGSIVWGRAREGMSLYDSDAVQTNSNSTAQISFDAKNYLQLGGSTLVIIRKIEGDTARDERRSARVVVDGVLSGRLTSTRLEVATPAAVARFNSSAGRPADFRLAVNADRSSSLSILKGSGEISAQGRTLQVGENRGAVIRAGEEPVIVELPQPPVALEPRDNGAFFFRELPPDIRFAWKPVNETITRLQIARDPAFRNVVVDRRSSDGGFIHGNLPPGVYFWKASSIRGGLEGQSTRPARFELVQKSLPPTLSVAFPDGAVGDVRFTLNGKSSPGAKVYVAGKQVQIDGAGRFSCEVPIRPGMNLVTVEAVDQAGNATFRSRYVQGRY